MFYIRIVNLRLDLLKVYDTQLFNNRKSIKRQREIQSPQKFISQRLQTDLGRSIGMASVVHSVWFTRFMGLTFNENESKLHLRTKINIFHIVKSWNNIRQNICTKTGNMVASLKLPTCLCQFICSPLYWAIGASTCVLP